MKKPQLIGNKFKLIGGKLALVAAGIASVGGSAATALTLIEAMDGTIYQRVGTSKMVPVKFTFSGQPSAVQARVVSVKTGETVIDWTTIAVNPSVSPSIGLIEVGQSGKWSKIEIRDSVDTTLVSTGVNWFGVGKRIALIGQSNMAHTWEGDVTYPLSDPRSRSFMNGVWDVVASTDKSGVFAPGTPAFGGGGWWGNSLITRCQNRSAPGLGANGTSMNGDGVVTLVNDLTANLDILVGTFEYAVGGTNIDQWLPGGNCWEPFAAAVRLADGDFEEAIYYQGEENAATAPGTFTTKVASVMSNCMQLAGRTIANFAFGVVTLGPCNGNGYTNFGPLRDAVAKFARTTPGVYLAAVAGDLSVGSGDSVHLDANARTTLCHRFSKASIAYGQGTPKPGPYITGASISNGVISVAITGGTGQLHDNANANGTSLKGFALVDKNGAAVAFTSAFGGSGVILTPAAGFVAPLSLSYGMADLPYGDFSPPAGAVVYDSDTLNLPLQPCAAITVTGS